MKVDRYFKIVVLILFFVGQTGNLCAQDSIKVNVPDIFAIIETGLQNNYNINVNRKMLDISKNEIRIYKGAFDPILKLDMEMLPKTQPGLDFKDKYSTSLSFVKPTKTGISIAAGLDVNNGYNLNNPTKLYSTSGFWFDLEIPILKGLGKNNRNLINYRLSKLKYETHQVNFKYEITRFIKDATLAYINLHIQNELYVKHMEIHQNLKKYRSDIKAQVDDGFVPATELINLDVEIMQFKSNISRSINKLNSSYINLEILIGSDSKHNAISAVEMSFAVPKINNNSIKIYIDGQMSDLDNIVKNALDIIKQNNIEESSKLEMKAAKKDKLNDFNLSLRYNNYSYVTGKSREINVFQNSSYPGASYTVGLNYTLPFRNNKTSGYYLAKLDEHKMEQTISEQLKFEKKKELENTAASLLNILGIYKMQDEICSLRIKAFKNEQLRYQIGNSTQMNVLNTHRDYSDAELNRINLKYQFLENWITFKFICNEIPTNTTELVKFDLFNFD